MSDEEQGPADGAIGDRVVRTLRSWVGRAARSGRAQLELRQLNRDLDHFWVRLGKTAFRLVEAGEIDHPALRKAMDRIEELEGRIDALKAERGADAEESP